MAETNIDVKPITPDQVPFANAVGADDMLVGIKQVDGVKKWFKFVWSLLVPSINGLGHWVIGGVDTGKTSVGKDGVPGPTGATGNGVSAATITYATSSSGATAPTDGWTATIPIVAANGFLWTRIVLAFTNGASQTFYTVSQSIKGDTGAKGDLIENPTAGNLPIMNASGNLVDSGHKPADFASLNADGKVKPSQLPLKPLSLSAPEKFTVTLGNTVTQKVGFTLLPSGVAQNVLFQCYDLEAIKFSADGTFTAKAVGSSDVWVTPTEATALRKKVAVEVVLPNIRIAGRNLRISGIKLRTV